MSKVEDKNTLWKALALAWELGYTIAVPLVIFALGGRLLDQRLGTTPIFLLIGILLALIVSTLGVYKKTTSIIKNETKR